MGESRAPRPARPEREVLAAVAAAIALLAIGFSAGFALSPPIRAWAARTAAERRSRAEAAQLAGRFLDREAPRTGSRTTAGDGWSVADEKGRVTVLFFWASWCPFSRAALPSVQQLYAAYKDSPDVRIVGVSVDRDRQALTETLKAQKVGWTVVYEDGKSWDNPVARAFNVHRVPSLWVVDRQGVVRAVDVDSRAATAAVAALLAGRPVAPDSRSRGRSASGSGGGCSS